MFTQRERIQDGNKRLGEERGGERGNSVADCEVCGRETEGISQASSQAQSAANVVCSACLCVQEGESRCSVRCM